MDMIKELFYGNIHPFERDAPKDSEGFINGFQLGVRLMVESFYGREIIARQHIVRCRAVLLLIREVKIFAV